MKAIMVEDLDYLHFKVLKKYIQSITGVSKLNYGEVHHLFTLIDKREILKLYIDEKATKLEQHAAYEQVRI